MKAKSHHTKEFREKIVQEAIESNNSKAVAEKYLETDNEFVTLEAN